MNNTEKKREIPKEVKAFWDWFDTARGDLPIRMVERRADTTRGRIGNAYSRKRKPSPTVMEAIADGLHLPVAEVFRRAGILDQGVMTDDLTLLQLLNVWRELTPDERREVLHYTLYRHRLRERGDDSSE